MPDVCRRSGHFPILVVSNVLESRVMIYEENWEYMEIM
jgi:PHD/YefM family antitoxin component YafN of YafNO toxin-antitoxin module